MSQTFTDQLFQTCFPVRQNFPCLENQASVYTEIYFFGLHFILEDPKEQKAPLSSYEGRDIENCMRETFGLEVRREVDCFEMCE